MDQLLTLSAGSPKNMARIVEPVLQGPKDKVGNFMELEGPTIIMLSMVVKRM